ncbi:MAG: acetoacetate decarboxylase family protein [bacterium]|nr:acetoacetate decarboxylase family protein [bacterium]
MMPLPNLPLAPAPWTLRGDAWVLFYAFPRQFSERPGVFVRHPRARARLHIGAVAWVDYAETNVGPYRELLIVPGLFTGVDGRWGATISRIYVDSAASVVGGRGNWGIPKDLAAFDMQREANGTERLTARVNGTVIAAMVCRPSRVSVTGSVRAGLVPLFQEWEGCLYRYSFGGGGRLHWLDVLSMRGDGEYFPALTALSPLAACRITGFTTTIDASQVTRL